MERLNEIIGVVTGEDRVQALILIGLFLTLFALELWFWLGRYGRIPKYRNRQRANPSTIDGISVVVILGDDFHYLEHTLPRIMAQDFPAFELVVIEVGSSPEFSDELKMLKLQYPNLSSARLDPDPRFRISDKMIYNVGIKTARYNNVMLATADAYPVSAKWLECMAKGFGNGEVVIGYCGLKPEKGAANRMMRCSRLMMSVRYLAAGIAGLPYRGIIQNLGFTKELYLDNRGFNHLDMAIGEDDLFVQKVATRDNTSIVMNPNATMRQTVWGGAAAWWRMRRVRGVARRYYPWRARMAASSELWVRFMLLITGVVCAVVLPLYTVIGIAAIWTGRLFIVRHQALRISKRLGEQKLGTAMMLYDIIEPFAAAAVSISRRIKPADEVWK